MSKYLYVFRGGHDVEASFSPEKQQSYMGEWMKWVEDLQKQSAYIAGDPLSKEGATIRGSDKLLTDGPYAEAKDLVGGYLLVELPSFDAAKEEATRCPIYQTNGSVEIRPILSMEQHAG